MKIFFGSFLLVFFILNSESSFADESKKSKLGSFMSSLNKAIEDASNKKEGDVANVAPNFGGVNFKCNKASIDGKGFDILGIRGGNICRSDEALFNTKINSGFIKGAWSVSGVTVAEALGSLVKYIQNNSNNFSTEDPVSGVFFDVYGDSFSDDKLVVGAIADVYSENIPSSDRVSVVSVVRKFCATDVANSLDSGNGFRSGLDQKYGQPSEMVSIDDELKKAVINREKLAPIVKANPNSPKSFEYMATVQRIESLSALKREVGADVVSLVYKNGAGDKFSIKMKRVSGCVAKTLFESELISGDANYTDFIFRAAKAKNEHDAARAIHAPVPGL
jgi:hypothetical protein